MKTINYSLAVLFGIVTGLASYAAEYYDNNKAADTDTPRILAHRGGRTEQDENTLAAFKATYEAGCHGFETDLHFDADKDLVVIHDRGLEALTDGEGIVEESTTGYIRTLKTKKGGNPVPFASELADYFSLCSTLYVEWEMKTNTTYYSDELIEEFCDKVYSEIMPRKPADALYVFSSFDERPLLYMKEKYPDVEVMLISASPCSHELVDHCISLGIYRCACGVDKTTREAVRYAHEKNFKVNLWPGGTEEDTVLALMLGADYLCTDIPAAVISYIKDHKLHISADGVTVPIK